MVIEVGFWVSWKWGATHKDVEKWGTSTASPKCCGSKGLERKSAEMAEGLPASVDGADKEGISTRPTAEQDHLQRCFQKVKGVFYNMNILDG